VKKTREQRVWPRSILSVFSGSCDSRSRAWDQVKHHMQYCYLPNITRPHRVSDIFGNITIVLSMIGKPTIFQ